MVMVVGWVDRSSDEGSGVVENVNGAPRHDQNKLRVARTAGIPLKGVLSTHAEAAVKTPREN
jgi:hypothetical protein